MGLLKTFCPWTPGQGKLIHSDYSQGGKKRRCTCTHTKGSTAAAKVNSFLTFMKIFTEHFSAICLNFAIWSKHLSQHRLYVLGAVPHRGLEVAPGSKSQIHNTSPSTCNLLTLRHRLTIFHHIVTDFWSLQKGLCKYPQPPHSPSIATLRNKGMCALPNLNTKAMPKNDSSGMPLVWGEQTSFPTPTPPSLLVN